MANGKTSYVCVPCRVSFKQPYAPEHERRCPRCAEPMIHAGSAFAAPRRHDAAAWRVLATLFDAGIGFHKSCCGGPGFRPRTPRETKEWMAQRRERLEWTPEARLKAARLEEAAQLREAARLKERARLKEAARRG